MNADGPREQVRAQMQRAAHALAGWDVGQLVSTHLQSGGKLFRAELAWRACQSLGCAPSLEWAAAVELLHGASLIHDDIEDHTPIRRHRPALWAQFGAARAINAGDALVMLAVQQAGLGSAVPPQALRLQQALVRAALLTAAGQGEDLVAAERWPLSWAAYERIALAKTGALFSLAVEGALVLAGEDAEPACARARPFAQLGLLLQVLNDLSDFTSSQPGGDLRWGRPNAVVVQFLHHHPTQATGLGALLRAPPPKSEEELSPWVEALRSQAHLQRMHQLLHTLRDQALGCELPRPLRELMRSELDSLWGVAGLTGE